MMRISEKKADAIFFITILIAGTLVILLARGVPLVAGATTVPWASTYENWLYRSPITVYNPNNVSLSGFQVNITLNASWPGWTTVTNTTELENSVRFALANGTTIPYWIQEWNSTAKKAIIWIKVPNIPAESSMTVYLYYGNQKATSESNGTAVFDFFDNGSLEGWTNNGAVLDTSTGLPSPSIKVTGGTYAYINTGINYAIDNYIIQVDMKIISGLNPLANLFFFCNSSGYGQAFRLDSRQQFYSGFMNTTSWTSWSGVKTNQSVDNPSTGVWYHVTIVVNGNSAVAIVSGLGTTPPFKIRRAGPYIAVHGDASIVTGGYFDNIIIRKYAPQMATAKVNATEEAHVFLVTFHLENTSGQAITNTTIVIDSQVYKISNGTVLNVTYGLHNITIMKPPKYSTVTLKNVNITGPTTLNITMPIARYNITFYAFANNTPISDYAVYATYSNNTTTLLGVFNNGESAALPYGLYILTLNQTPYTPVHVVVNLTHDMNVTFKTQKGDFSLVSFNFYNVVSSSTINNVTVIVKNSTNTLKRVLDNAAGIWLKYGVYNITVEKTGYQTQTLSITVNKTNVYLTFYLQPTSQQAAQTTPRVNITAPGMFVNVSNNTPFVGARVFNYLASFRLDKAFPAFLHLNPLFAIFIPLILTLGISVASWYFTHNGLVVLGVLAISGTFWYLAGINLQLSLLQPLAVVVIFFIAWAIWSFYRTKEAGE